MLPSPTLLLAVLALAAPARSALVAGASASPSAWVGGVAGALAAAGTERVDALGSPALTGLSTLNAAAAFPFASQPRLLLPLAEKLSAQGLEPETFAALPLEARLSALRAAAAQAEAEAAAIADEALPAAEQPPRRKTLDRAALALERVQAVAPYLDPARRARVKAAGRLQAAFRAKWAKDVSRFLAGLGDRIAAGELDASNVLKKTEDGWVAADEELSASRENLNSLYLDRLSVMRRAPQGPWIQDESLVLDKALNREDVAAGIAAGGGAVEPLRLQLKAARDGAMAAYLKDTPLGRARDAFRKNAENGFPVDVEHVKTVVARYGAWAASYHSLPAAARVIAWIRSGDSTGLPSMSRLLEARRAAVVRARRAVWTATGVFLASMPATVALSGPAATLGAAGFVLLILVFGGAMAYWIRAIWRRDSLDWTDIEPLERAVRQFFPND